MVASVSSADSAIQSDWSGGPGVSGPVVDWGDSFSSGWGLVWSDPGRLLLEQGSITTVDDSLQGPLSIHCFDTNNDGYEDILLGTWQGGEILLWENSDTAPGIIWNRVPILENSPYLIQAIAIGDMDTDGDPDAVTAIQGMYWFENQGSGLPWTLRALDPTMTQFVHGLHTGDLNGDGFTDVVAAAAGDNIYWWRNNGGSGTEWSRFWITYGASDPQSVYCADIDGDGYMDVVAGGGYGHVSWYRNLYGSGTAWLGHAVESGLPPVLSVCAADIDGDGDMDIAAALLRWPDTRGSDSGEVLVWWENLDGTGTSWVKHVVEEGTPNMVKVEAADLDGDGDMDLLGGTNSWTHGHSWYESTHGTGLNWVRHPLTGDHPGGGALCAGHVNQDGVLDVVGTAGGSIAAGRDLFWWDLQGGYTPDGFVESSVLYLNCDPSWGMMTSVVTTPPGTSTGFQVRASDDPENMGSWSDTLMTPYPLEDILAPDASYLQYRVILSTEDPLSTPELTSITVDWNPLGTSDPQQTVPPTYALHPVSPHPASGIVTIRFSVPEPASVEISVFDLSGRIIRRFNGESPPGISNLSIGGLVPGIYFIRMRAGAFAEARRFAVVER
jgi:hypothetical protein